MASRTPLERCDSPEHRPFVFVDNDGHSEFVDNQYLAKGDTVRVSPENLGALMWREPWVVIRGG